MKKITNIIASIILIILIIFLVLMIINKKNTNKYTLDEEYYNNSTFIEKDANEVNTLLNSTSTFILFTYNNYCTLPISCESVFYEYIKKYNISIVKLTFEDFKKTYLYDEVKLAPSVLLISNGKIIDYLHADSDEDLSKYQELSSFESWINSYINTR